MDAAIGPIFATAASIALSSLAGSIAQEEILTIALFLSKRHAFC